MLDFILYALAFGGALSVVALCMEHLAAIRGKPRRLHWLLAMLCSVLLPPLVAMNTRPQPVAAPIATERTHLQPVPPDAVDPAFTSDHLASFPPAANPATPPASRPLRVPEPARRTLLLAWAAASGTLLLLLAGAALRLRRRASRWQRVSIGELEVLVSDHTGPALIGSLRPRIVVPQWFMDESADTQSLILQHEQQHVVARDPLLLRAALLMALVTPWNLPLWWQLHRLRLAIELDCDARVMRSGTEPARYGQVLLGVTRRAARMPVGAIAMSEPASALEQRIRSLMPVTGRYGRLRMIGASLIAAAGVGAAAALEAPALGTPPATRSAASATDTASKDDTATPMAPVQSTSPPTAAGATAGSAGEKTQKTEEQLRLAFAMEAVIDDRLSIDGQVNPNFGKPVCRVTRDGIPANNKNQPLDPQAREALQAIAKDCKPLDVPGIALQTTGTSAQAPTAGSIDASAQSPAATRRDVEIIPSELRERMNVVTGGASATYGSGAMAGVVNLVLNNRLKGITLDLDGGAQPSPELRQAAAASILAQRLKEAEQKLAELRQRFNDKHPDVVAQKTQVEFLRTQQSGRPWARPTGNPMELRGLINEMSEQWGWRFVIDPRVQGAVDIGNLNPNDPDSLTYHAFLEILAVHGFVAIRSDDVVTIVPGEYARSIATPTVRLVAGESFYMGDDAEVVTAVIPVESRDAGQVNAQQLAKLLAPLVSPWGYLTQTQDGKSLLMVDKVANVKRISELAWGRTGKD